VIGGNTAAAGGSTVVITLAGSTTAGDVINVGGCGDGVDLPSSVADSQGNTYTLVESANVATVVATYQAGATGTPTVALGPGDTITVTYTGTSGAKAVSAVGVPNLPANSLDLPGSSVTGATSSAPNLTTFGLAESTEVQLVTLASANAGGLVSWTDGVTFTLDSRHSGTGPWLVMAYQFVSLLPQITITGSLSASVTWNLVSAGFKEV
jgi:hypothetical protein